ncbi:MAG: energy transducer TonB [Nitrospira sp.]|nr:energy transducer TonB [Nitrospira sp.]
MSLALPLDSSQRQRASLCWAFSMSIHGLFVGMAVLLLTEMPPPPPPVFKWDVAVVQTPPPAAEPAPPPSVESQPPPTPQPVTPPKPKQVPVAKAQPVVRQVQEVQQPVQQIQPVQQVQPVLESLPVQTAQTVQQVTTQQVETVAQTIQETVSPTSEVVQTVVDTTAVVSETAPVIQQYSTPQAVASSAPVTRQVEASTQVAAVVSDVPAVESAPAPVEAPPHIRQEIVQRPVQTVQQRVVKQREVHTRPGERPDYGWLSQALWSSVDQRKRYPAEAKRNHWEGRVILRLTIEQRGAAVHLLNLSLEESSGHSVLDRHTLDMVRNAFPLKVKHEMAQSKLELDLPFSYRME